MQSSKGKVTLFGTEDGGRQDRKDAETPFTGVFMLDSDRMRIERIAFDSLLQCGVR